MGFGQTGLDMPRGSQKNQLKTSVKTDKEQNKSSQLAWSFLRQLILEEMLGPPQEMGDGEGHGLTQGELSFPPGFFLHVLSGEW